jgi:release factor glutamine methyltransferase
MTLRQLASDAESVLHTGPHPERARLDAEVLLLHTLSQDRAWLIAHWNDDAESVTEKTYANLITRRQAGEPLQYITGKSDFFGLPFSVGPGVLIPRPETEHLVEEVIRLVAQFQAAELKIADIGTGSGIIAVALANALPNALLTAVDCSPQALTIARENAHTHQVESRIDFREGDLLAPLAAQKFHIIASNPPYIPTSDHDSLSVEVRDHEPHAALFAGEDGLAIYRRLVPEARALLLPGGWLVLEIGFDQQSAIENLLLANAYREVHFIPDYQGIPRVAIGRLDH